MRWGKLTAAIILSLLLFQSTVYGAPPSALDIYNQLLPLQPGENINIAHDLLGPPHEIGEREGELLPHYWQRTTKTTNVNVPAEIIMVVILRNNSIIDSSTYIEVFEQAVPAHQRYLELKEGFHNTLRAPFGEGEYSITWAVGNFRLKLGLDYLDVNSTSEQSRTIVIVSFFSGKRE